MHIKEEISRTYDRNILTALGADPDKCLFMDIETTGFSPESSDLYLIGCIHEENGRLIKEQFLAESPDRAPEILRDFLKMSKDYPLWIEFNGDQFDIPYLKKAADKYGITDPLLYMRTIDIYKELRHYRKILKLDHLRQKDVERYLGIDREDKMSGGELINVYQTYACDGDPVKQKLLLLHNSDDICGMQEVLSSLAYPALFQGRFEAGNISPEGDSLIMDLRTEYNIPVRIALGNAGITLNASGHSARLTVQMQKGIKKHFFEPVSEYWYLPDEDRAIHKSLAMFVDRGHRQKASKENCCEKREDIYIPLPKAAKKQKQVTDLPLYRDSFDGPGYITLDTFSALPREAEIEMMTAWMEAL